MYHIHHFSGMTSVSQEHAHGYQGRTSPAITGMPHIHFMAGFTDTVNGHRHYYFLMTGFDRLVPGGHIHYYSGITYLSKGHYHIIKGKTAIK